MPTKKKKIHASIWKEVERTPNRWIFGGGERGRLGTPELFKYLLLDLMEVRVPAFLMINLMKHMEHEMCNHCVAAHPVQTYMRRVGCQIHNGLECEQKSLFIAIPPWSTKCFVVVVVFKLLVLNCLIKKIHEIISDNWNNPWWPRFSCHFFWDGWTVAHTHVLADTLVLTSWSPEVCTHFTHLHRISKHIFTFRTNSNYLSNSRWSQVPPVFVNNDNGINSDILPINSKSFQLLLNHFKKKTYPGLVKCVSVTEEITVSAKKSCWLDTFILMLHWHFSHHWPWYHAWRCLHWAVFEKQWSLSPHG